MIFKKNQTFSLSKRTTPGYVLGVDENGKKNERQT
jgi:hypothetical protein